MNKERLNHKGYCDKIALSINDKKYNVNSKDIENILDGKGDLFKKRTLWEFVRDLFPGSHIKEVKGLIYELSRKLITKPRCSIRLNLWQKKNNNGDLVLRQTLPQMKIMKLL
ncbi:putative type III effector protein [Escherichia coli]|uniref:Putative type III effector protein n=1 Tax=Escherichia coli TaxID=562 RepID=A0A3S4LZC3_ECOLX|nr:putative type III effector protein [Escherichia coli]